MAGINVPKTTLCGAEPLRDDTGSGGSGGMPATGGRRPGRPGRKEAQVRAAAAAAARAGQPLGDLAQHATGSSAVGEGAPAGGGRRRKRARESPEKPQGPRRVGADGRTQHWRPKPSQQVKDRIERAMPGLRGHRLLLLDRRVVRPVGAPEGAKESFAVMGATGNVYNVTIGRHPACTCPDCGKGNICKHVLFVLLRVLHLPTNQPLVWQKALLPGEVDEVLSGRHSLPRSLGGGGGDVLAPEAVQTQYRRLSDGGGSDGAASSSAPAARPAEGCDCPVCFEPLVGGGGQEGASFCSSCRNSVHTACMEHWVRSRRGRGIAATCPLCRAPLLDGAALAGTADGGASGSGQYLNLAQYSAAHQGADTSLTGLYGNSAIWIQASQGRLSRRQAANAWRQLGH